MSQPKERPILLSNVCLKEICKCKKCEFFLLVKIQEPEPPPPKKRSILDSIWVWLLLVLGMNFVVGDPIGFTENNSPKESPPLETSPQHDCEPPKRNRKC